MDNQTTFCTNCRSNISAAAFALHEATCTRHRWYCEACEEALPRKDRERHIQKFHAIVECDCGEQIEVCHLEAHKQVDCERRLVPCSFCRCPLPHCEIPEHEYHCGARTEQCELCNNWVQIRNLDTHVCPEPEPESEPSPPSSPPPLTETEPQPDQNELVICPFCLSPAADYTALQMHIFAEHETAL